MKNNFVDKRINLMAQGRVDYTVEAFSVSNEQHGMMMGIPTEEGCIYVTKEQAIDFFSPICFDMDELVKKWREYPEHSDFHHCANDLDRLLDVFRSNEC